MDDLKYPCCTDCKFKPEQPDYSHTQCFHCDKGSEFVTADKRYLRMFGVLGVMPGCLGCDNQPAKTIPDGCHSCCQTDIFTPGSNYKKTDKPPRGIKPRWMMLEHRNREIIEAMHRRADTCMDNSEPITLDPQWIMELLENNKELLARCKP